ncbi:MAG TPA: NAD(+)/NADH kinase [bacterium (Candidatus Stahlbacteria)]|nr:NAD(+)/NADH kinase [Candidatus Stahlbacteria bacterium]
MGGDGAMLNAARHYVDSEIPLFGINLGGLGFLTDVSVDRIEEAIGLLEKGEYQIEERIMVSVRIGEKVMKGLNDIVIFTGTPGRAIELSAWVEDEYICRFIADGLIIATPTGSTAYSLACGGPIIFPTTENLVITPISAHTLSVRPIVVPAENRIRVRIGQKGRKAWLIGDGQEKIGLKVGDEVTIFKYPKSVRLIKLKETRFTETLRSKMRWGGRENA